MRFLYLLVLLPLALPGCTTEDVTQEEAQGALDEANYAANSSALTAEMTEVTTNFTIGQGVQQGAQKLKEFLATEIPCAKLTLADATLTVDFGALSDKCTWHGHAVTGTVSVHVDRNTDGDVQVTHTWTKVSNGKTIVSGTAVVTWQSALGQRHVVHDFTATEVDGTRSIVGHGDRVQKLVDSSKGWAGGIQIDGERDWTASSGKWLLTIAGVQIRGIDPVPQAGSYSLTLPSGKVLTLTFSRASPTSIDVVVSGGKRTYTFHVVSIQGS